jgi:hypothetical protein
MIIYYSTTELRHFAMKEQRLAKVDRDRADAFGVVYARAMLPVTAGFSEWDPHRMINMRALGEELVSLAKVASTCGQVSTNATRCHIHLSSHRVQLTMNYDPALDLRRRRRPCTRFTSLPFTGVVMVTIMKNLLSSPARPRGRWRFALKDTLAENLPSGLLLNGHMAYRHAP